MQIITRKEQGCLYLDYKSKTYKIQKRSLHNNTDNSTERYYNINVFASNIKAPNYIKQTLSDLKGEMRSNRMNEPERYQVK